MYDTAEESKQKLQDSIVIYEGNPVYVANAGGKKGNVNLHFKPLPLNPRDDPSSNLIIRSISETGWDFRSIGTKLGYTEVKNPNGKMDSVFISRVPVRHSRQGLDSKTTQLLGYDREYDYTWNNIIYENVGLGKTIRNEYLTPKAAFDKLYNHSDTFKSIPIHRKLALFYDHVSPPYLLYRLDKVGYTEDGVTYKLARHKSYLAEELTDMIGLKIA